jgi:hypothetical protein
MLDSANFWCFCRFFGLFGSNGFYSFISGGNSFFLIELNPWIFKFSLINYNSMVEFSDWFQGFLNFLKGEITLEKYAWLFMTFRGVGWLIECLIGFEKFIMIFILRLFVGLYKKLTDGRGTHPKRLLFLKSNLFGILVI